MNSLAAYHTTLVTLALAGLLLVVQLVRIAHMGFYYGNKKPLRSLSFAVSLVALLGLAATVLAARRP